MLKRTFSGIAWFAAVWVAYEIAWTLTDIPRIFGPVLGFAIAALVAVDPAKAFWPRTETIRDRSRTPAAATAH